MASDTEIAIGLHAHQPVGNFSRVFDQLTGETYQPFLEHFQQYDAGKISFHASGPLLNWWENNHSDMIELIGSLVENNRLELLSAGYYEPILAIIPREDRMGQIEKYNHYIEELFGVTPRGAWLTERVWTPELARDLNESGIEYTVADDFHFRAIGWDPDELSRYYVTEYEGQTLGVFPISQELRYRIPFHEVDDIIDYTTNARGQVLTMADDLEKFGSWPDTQSWVYEEGWLDRFFTAVEAGDITISSLGDCYEQYPPKDRCYLPTASYEEMVEWALPSSKQEEYFKWKNEQPDRAEQFGRGGDFQHFLVKYPESNRLHKRMLWLSQQIDSNHPSTARDHLYAGQCNDVYWHGVFGGVFLPHMRAALWKQLCQSHEAIDQDNAYLMDDFDCDGLDEAIVDTDHLFGVVDPQNGSEMTVCEIYPPGRNILDTLSRQWQPYLQEEHSDDAEDDSAVDTIHHQKTSVPTDWLKEWSEDSYPRAGFQPIEYEGELSPDQISLETGVNYLWRGQQAYETQWNNATLESSYESPGGSIEYRFNQQSFTWSAQRESNSSEFWGPMSTVGIRSAKSDRASLIISDTRYDVSEMCHETTTDISLQDKMAECQITFQSSKPVECLTYPVRSISRSESDAERIYQGTAVCLLTGRHDIQIECSWDSLND